MAGSLYLGRYAGSSGTYSISVGSLEVGNLVVGSEGSGTLNITDAGSSITVSGSLQFGSDSSLTAVSGSTINMTGSNFVNNSTSESNLAGLSNLTLIFEGGSSVVDTFEIASLVAGGFVNNFALGTLTLGGADVGMVQLVDLFDNGNRDGSGKESLFLYNLLIGAGSLLDIHGLDIFVYGNEVSQLDAWIAAGRIIDSSDPQGYLGAVWDAQNGWTTLETQQQPVIPEPTTIVLVGLGLLALAGRARRRAE